MDETNKFVFIESLCGPQGSTKGVNPINFETPSHGHVYYYIIFAHIPEPVSGGGKYREDQCNIFWEESFLSSESSLTSMSADMQYTKK